MMSYKNILKLIFHPIFLIVPSFFNRCYHLSKWWTGCMKKNSEVDKRIIHTGSNRPTFRRIPSFKKSIYIYIYIYIYIVWKAEKTHLSRVAQLFFSFLRLAYYDANVERHCQSSIVCCSLRWIWYDWKIRTAETESQNVSRLTHMVSDSISRSTQPDMFFNTSFLKIQNLLAYSIKPKKAHRTMNCKILFSFHSH